MFKTIKHIKKKIIAATMAATIMVSGNIGTSSVSSGNHSVTDTTVTVNAQVQVSYYCLYCNKILNISTEEQYETHLLKKHNVYRKKYKCQYCGYELKNQTALDAHEQSCPSKPYICDCIYKDYGCTKTKYDNIADYLKHISNCPYEKGSTCPCCFDYTTKNAEKYKTHVNYDCLKNKKRQLTEDRQLDLTNRGLKLPTWNVDKTCWECPYPELDCKKTFSSPWNIKYYQEKTEDLVVEHIHCHYKDAKQYEAFKPYF